MKKITLFIFSLVLTQFSFGQCNYTLEMNDSYGDGWSSTIDVLVDGVVVLDDKSAAGAQSIETFPVSVGADITAVFTAVGSWTGEASYKIIDAEGTTVAEKIGGGGDQNASPPDDVTTGTITAVCPSCVAPSDILSINTTTTADVSWTAGGGATSYEYVRSDYGTGEPVGSGTTISATSVSLTGLSSGSLHEFYVRSVCGTDYSGWTFSFIVTECEVATTASTNDFTSAEDITCWGILDLNPGGSSSWSYSSSSPDGPTGYWFLPYEGDFSTQHDDVLLSQAFTVIDNVTDGFEYKVTRPDSQWVNRYDIVVYSDVDGSELGVLATDFIPAFDGATYSHDLSTFEGQAVRIGFYDKSIADNQDTYRIDDFKVASYTSLGIEEVSILQFTYFPNPVNDLLTIKAQRSVEEIIVYNMLGQVVKRQAPNTRECTVDLSGMQTGAYFVQVSIDNTVETVRVLKN